MRLLFVTQTLDLEHPALAQTVDLVHALASRVDELVVLCQSVGVAGTLPANARVVVFGAASRPARAARFLRALARELRRPPDAMLAHMVPLYVVLGGPLARARGVRVGLWYTHWHAGTLLALALRIADVVLSVDVRSFPLASPKVRGIGHAIDVDRFSPRRGERRPGPLRLLALGRTARWKGYETMLDALEAGGADAELEIRGPQLTEDERAHRAELERRVATTPALAGRVRLEPPVARAEIPVLLADADALVSATQPRAGETLDKVVYEAAAAGTPVLASNEALAGFLDGLPLRLRFPVGDAAALAQLVAALGAADEELRAATGEALRARVVSAHSLDSWATSVTALLSRNPPQ